jgi:hypothetical protein
VKIDKDAGINITLSTVVTLATVSAGMWAFGKPWLMDEVGLALAQDIRDTVQEEIAPIKGGLQVIIAQTIIRLRKDIAQLERKQAAEGLSAEETNLLVDLRAELEAQVMALNAFKG